MNRPQRTVGSVTAAATLLGALLLPSGTPCFAESVFSVNGLGETVFGVDARGMAMGSAGLATPSPWHISLENPALLADVGRFSFGAALIPEIRRVELEESDKSASFAYVPFVRLTKGLPGGLNGAAALGMQHRVSYWSEERRIEDDVEIVDVRSGDGGPGFVSLTLAKRVHERALVGAELRVLVGTIEDERNVRFVGETALETRDVVKTSFGGEPMARVGGYFELGRGFGLGWTYQFSRVMDVATTVIARDVEVSREESDFHYPAMGGLGLSFRPNERATLTAEWFRAGWSRTGTPPGYRGEMSDSDRLSFGFEWKHGEGDYRLPLRVGYLWRELSYRAAGSSDAPTEFAFTFGLGLPFRQENGSFDVAVQIGARGDLELDRARERFLRFSLSMVGTEFLGYLTRGTD